MTVARQVFEENEAINSDTLLAFIAKHNPGSKQEFYARDMILWSARYGVNWVGVFAIAYLLTDGDPFWVGLRTDPYKLEGGALLRYGELAKEIRQQYTWGQHFSEKSMKFGKIELEGALIEQTIQQIVDFAEASPKNRKGLEPIDPKPEPKEPTPAPDKSLDKDKDTEPPSPPKPPEEKPSKPPLWWGIAKRVLTYGLTAALGAVMTKVPILGQYVDEIVAVVIGLIESLLF